MTPTDDDIARTELLMSAVRIARDDNEDGDPDRILEAVAHPSLDIAQVHRLFASLIEAADDIEAAGDDIGRRELATAHFALAALVMVFGEPEVVVDNTLTDAESSAA